MHDFRMAAERGGGEHLMPLIIFLFFFLVQKQFLNLTTVRHNGFFFEK